MGGGHRFSNGSLDDENPWGDRRTELVVIGQNMDHAAMEAALLTCVVTDDEMTSYNQTRREEVVQPSFRGMMIGLEARCESCGAHQARKIES